MTANAPLMTIGITAYNAQSTIEKAVRSAAAQTWENVEIIVVDDGSSDETPRILTDLTKTYPTLKIITHPQNQGVAAARNTILNNAAGAFVAFFDDDDVSEPHRLKAQYDAILAAEVLKGENAPILCHTPRIQIYPDGQRRTETAPGTDINALPGGEAMALRILCGRPVAGGFGSMATCSQMARNAVYKSLGGFDEAFRRAEDTDLAVRLALAGGYFVSTPEPLVTQTMTHGDEKRLESERQAQLQLFEKHKAFIARHIPYDFILRWTQARFHYLARRHGAFFGALLALLVKHPVLCLQKLFWALPNRGFYKHQRAFHG